MRQVRTEETNASEPLMTCRNLKDDVKTGGNLLSRDQPGGYLITAQGGIRHTGGVNSVQAPMRNVGTCRPDTGVSRACPGLDS